MKRRTCIILMSAFMVMAAALVFVHGVAEGADPVLRMATTTSTDNTGLLDMLAPVFHEDTGIELQWVAVGTGKALALGQNCDVDILMVHAPAAEKDFVAKGYGRNRRETMYNDFVIIGPTSDPAHISGLSVSEALKRIVSQKALFASRGDDSGTNKREKALWRSAGIPLPERERWYIQTGQGMINTITIAEESDAYTLTDRGTYIKYEANKEGNPPLVILVEGDPSLNNQYSVIAVNPDRCDNVAYDRALVFIDWITSEKVQTLIGNFTLLGKKLFIPNAR
jgi:tungstate transport system substrate-binding protein